MSDEAHFQRSGLVFADQFAQIALTRHKGNNGNRPIGPLRLDEFRQLGALLGNKIHVASARGKP